MRKNKVLILLFTGVISITLVSAFFFGRYEGNAGPKKDPSTTKSAQHANTTISNELKPDSENLKLLGLTSSGATTSVPWENDEKFLNAKNAANTPVLMGAYRTVLRDPLPGEEYNVHLAAQLLAGTVINPGEVFSQNGRIGPYTEARGFQRGPTYIGSQLTTTIGGGVCKIASTLYNVIILSNLTVIERHNHSMPVPYVPYGQDATVSYGAKDVKFKNNTSGSMLIWAQGVGNTLYIGFYGISKPPKVEWHHEVLSTQKAPLTYRKNPDLAEGTEKVVLEGMDGASIKSWLTIYNTDGTTTTKELGISNYKPMAFIIEKSN